MRSCKLRIAGIQFQVHIHILILKEKIILIFVPPTTINATFKDIFSEVHKNITTFFYNEYNKNEVAFAVYDKNKSSTFNGNVVGSLASGFVGAITQSTWAGIFTSISYGYANNYYDKNMKPRDMILNIDTNKFMKNGKL